MISIEIVTRILGKVEIVKIKVVTTQRKMKLMTLLSIRPSPQMERNQNHQLLLMILQFQKKNPKAPSSS